MLFISYWGSATYNEDTKKTFKNVIGTLQIFF